MKNASPESKGIPSYVIEKYLAYLEENHLVTHNVLISRGDSLVLEKYIAPFHKDFLHRMYSVTKSFVSLAIGFALDDGYIRLDDPICEYFPKETADVTDENMKQQTIRNMLMMATCKYGDAWFDARIEDRVDYYFHALPNPAKKPGTHFDYDSSGTFVLGALVERVTGRSLEYFLREKLWKTIGVSEGGHFLRCPGGHSWGDSAALITARDLWKIARFTLNGGNWEGKQLIHPDYIREAVSCLISTSDSPSEHPDGQGYGYYIWKTWGEGFFFNGMGCQFAVCVPEKDMILVYNGDNQGNSTAIDTVIGGFYKIVLPYVKDEVLPENPDAQTSLQNYQGKMQLMFAYGSLSSPMAEQISGKRYLLEENPMGIRELTITLRDGEGIFAYTNAQGKKEYAFGLGKNLFGLFPQDGYSDEVGSRPGHHRYGCAASAAWKNDNELWIKTQLIDDYFGNFDATFIFSENGENIRVKMEKTAEDFLREYQGEAKGTRG